MEARTQCTVVTDARVQRRALIIGVFLAATCLTPTPGSADTITPGNGAQSNLFNFLDYRASGDVILGNSPGLRLSIGGNFVPNPPGTSITYTEEQAFAAQTTVTATQGTKTVNVPYINSPALPEQFFKSMGYNQNLIGSWTLKVTNPNYGTYNFTTNSISADLFQPGTEFSANPQSILQGVTNITTDNPNSTTPTLSWIQPAYSIPAGMTGKTNILLNNAQGTIIGAAILLSNTTSSFQIPASWGLSNGNAYVVQVNTTLDTTGSGGYIAASTRTYFDLHPSSAPAPAFAGPVYLPTSQLNSSNNPVYNFNINVSGGQTYNIDPAIAIGYIFQTGLGDPNFASVTLPDIGNLLPYELFLWDGSSYLFDTFLNAKTTFNFASGGVDRFEILGIDPSLLLDPTNTSAFVAQLTFVGNGTFTGTMTPITEAPTPLPAALPLFAGGLGMMGLLGWRRKRKAAASAA